MRTAICINTFRRPEQLRGLLDSIAQLRFGNEPAPIVDVIVVNNDADNSVEPVLEEMRRQWPWRLHGLTEPRRGIPQARNRAIQHAQSLAADYYVFVDDDEVVDPDWLAHLLKCARDRGAAMAQGRVVPRFMTDAPSWAIEGHFFEGGRAEKNLVPGQPLVNGATNNLLVRADVVSIVGLFDEWWQTQGGDDTEFTLRAMRFGFHLIWCPEAIVYEWIPPARLSVGWLLKRGFRSGNTYGLIHRRVSTSSRGKILSAFACFAYLGLAVFHQVTSLFSNRAKRIKRRQELFWALGTLSGLLGYKYLEYQKPLVSEHFRPPSEEARQGPGA